jgi:hypothetical protein
MNRAMAREKAKKRSNDSTLAMLRAIVLMEAEVVDRLHKYRSHSVFAKVCFQIESNLEIWSKTNGTFEDFLL